MEGEWVKGREGGRGGREGGREGGEGGREGGREGGKEEERGWRGEGGRKGGREKREGRGGREGERGWRYREEKREIGEQVSYVIDRGRGGLTFKADRALELVSGGHDGDMMTQQVQCL